MNFQDSEYKKGTTTHCGSVTCLLESLESHLFFSLTLFYVKFHVNLCKVFWFTLCEQLVKNPFNLDSSKLSEAVDCGCTQASTQVGGKWTVFLLQVFEIFHKDVVHYNQISGNNNFIKIISQNLQLETLFNEPNLIIPDLTLYFVCPA